MLSHSRPISPASLPLSCSHLYRLFTSAITIHSYWPLSSKGSLDNIQRTDLPLSRHSLIALNLNHVGFDPCVTIPPVAKSSTSTYQSFTFCCGSTYHSMGKLIKNHLARLIVMTAATCKLPFLSFPHLPSSANS